MPPRSPQPRRRHGSEQRQRGAFAASGGVRLHSASFLASTTSLWLTASVFCLTCMYKLDGTLQDTSWWAIFSPLLIGNAAHIVLMLYVLCTVLGPPPPASSSTALHAQYEALRIMCSRNHLIDTTITILDSMASLVVKAVFAQLLDVDRFQRASMRLVFLPVWMVWIASVVLSCSKHRRDRFLCSLKHLIYIFLLMVAFKVDGLSTLPWQVVFLVPWLWLGTMLLMGLVVLGSLVYARAWARTRELIMPMGSMLLMFSSSIPQFAFFRALAARLEGNTSVTMQEILIPGAVGWAAMWASSVVMAAGLRMRERARFQLLSSGAVWVAHEALLARRGGGAAGGAQVEEQRRVEALPESEVLALAREKMARNGCTAPDALVRVGPLLYKLPHDSAAIAAAGLPVSKPTGADGGNNGDGLGPGIASTTAKAGHVVIELPPSPQGTGTEAPRPGAAPRATTQQALQHAEQLSHPAQPEAAIGGREPLAHEGLSRNSRNVEHDGGGQRILPALLDTPTEGLAALLGIEAGGGDERVSGAGDDGDDDGQCVICYDGTASCVLLGCGHGGFCSRCAHLLMVRPPHDCPTCRRQIEQVVALQHTGPVGSVCPVVPQPPHAIADAQVAEPSLVQQDGAAPQSPGQAPAH